MSRGLRHVRSRGSHTIPFPFDFLPYSSSSPHPLPHLTLPTSFSLSVVACVDHQGYQLLLRLVDAENFVSIPLLRLFSCPATTFIPSCRLSSIVLAPLPASSTRRLIRSHRFDKDNDKKGFISKKKNKNAKKKTRISHPTATFTLFIHLLLAFSFYVVVFYPLHLCG